MAQAANPSVGGIFQFADGNYTDGCLGIWGGAPNNGAQEGISYRCRSASQAVGDQAWAFDTKNCIEVQEETGNTIEFCTLESALNRNKCLGTYAGSTNFGAFAVIWDRLGKDHEDQYWNIDPRGDGSFTILNLKAVRPLCVIGKSSGILEQGLGYQPDAWYAWPAFP